MPTFVHDSDARNDERCIQLRMTHGERGYGLYWMMIEMFSEATLYRMVNDPRAVAFSLNSDPAFVEQVISMCLANGLFATDDSGKTIHSPSLLRRMARYDEVLEKRRAAGKLRHFKPLPASAEQVLSKCTRTEQNRTEQNEEGESEREDRDPTLVLAPKISMRASARAKLVEEFGEESVLYHVTSCSNYLQAEGKTKKDAGAFIRNWIRKEIAECKGYYSKANQRQASQLTFKSATERKREREEALFKKYLTTEPLSIEDKS